MPTSRENSRVPAKSKEFDDLLLNAIDNSFTSLGESIKQSIYFHLDEQFQLKRTQIPRSLNKFQTSIEKIFGTGARFLEILIMKNLHLKMDISIEAEDNVDINFIEYVKRAKDAYIAKE